jgi:pre-mRNA-splicing factor SYF1
MPSESTTALTDDIKELLANEQDLEFEQEISRNPFSLKAWLRYLGSKSLEKRKERYVLYER